MNANLFRKDKDEAAVLGAIKAQHYFRKANISC